MNTNFPQSEEELDNETGNSQENVIQKQQEADVLPSLIEPEITMLAPHSAQSENPLTF